MIDSNSQFFAILTAIGEAKQANANALGVPWKLTQLGVGDANGTDPIPSRLQTKLINERRRALLNQLKIDPDNPSVLVAEQVIPADVGGWWVREIGLYDYDGDLVAVANCAPSFKPLLSQGSGRTQIVRMNFIVSSITNVVLKIDPAVVLATREYVDTAIDTILPGNKAPGTYRQVTINKYGVVLSGANPTTLAGFGITDAYTKTEAGQSFASRAVTLAGYNIGDAYTKAQVDGSLSGKADKTTTLAGYGITDAYTKTEVGQSFASRAVTLAGYNIGDAYTKAQIDAALLGKAPNVAASESVAGISAASTQTQTNTGVDDATFVTPKKLRAGFLSSFTTNGFIAFPTWLGGLVIQWGRTAVLTDGSGVNVSLPFTFPSTTLQMWTSLYGSVSGDSAACRVSAGQFVSLSQINVSYNETNSALGGSAVTWFCVGF